MKKTFFRDPIIRIGQLFIITLIVFSSFLNSFGQAVEVGSAVGYAKLSDALGTVIPTVNSQATTDLIIKGDFDFDFNITYLNATFTVDDDSNPQQEIVVSSPITFENVLFNFSLDDRLDINASSVIFDNCDLVGHPTSSNLFINGGMTARNGSTIINFTGRVDNVMVLNNVVMDNSDFTFQGSVIDVKNSVLKNSNAPVLGSIFLIRQGLFLSNGNTYENNVFPIYMNGDPSSNGGDVYISNDTFTNNTISIIGISNSGISVTNSVFDGGSAAIVLEAGLGRCTIANNHINNTTGDRAIGILNGYHDQVKINDNVLNNISSGNENGAITISGSRSPIVDGNNVINGGSNGIYLYDCEGAQVTYNYLKNSNCNINALSCDYASIYDNDVLDASVAGMVFSASTDLNVSCNEADNNKDGAIFEGLIVRLNYAVNDMSNSTDEGLRYRGDVMASPQVEKGNTWDSNNHGAVFENNPSATQILNGRYEVRNIALENPQFMDPNNVSPVVDWFDDGGSTFPGNCVFLPGGAFTSNDINALLNAIDCSSSSLGDGYCTWHMIKAFEYIDEYPALLNNNDIAAFNTNYSGTAVDLFPTINEILQDLPEPNYPYMELEFDSNGEPINLTAYLNYLENSVYPVYSQYISNISATLSNWYSTVSSISTTTAIEADYKTMMLFYIDVLQGDTLNPSDSSAIAVMASNCVKDYGPAVYIARSIATNLSLSYTLSTGCLTSSPPSVISSLDEDELGKGINVIYPNPVEDVLYLKMEEYQGKIDIIDALGRVYLSTIYQGGLKEINTKVLSSGVYFLKPHDDQNNVMKFIKE